MSLEQREQDADHQSDELKIMAFTIDDNLFGLDVVQVREIMMPEPVKEMPYAPSVVEGVFKPRDRVITVVNLPRYLELNTSLEGRTSLFIVTEFGDMMAAFRVQGVVGINQIRQEDIQQTDQTFFGGREGVVTGVVSCDNRLVTILDFKKIIADIAPVLNDREMFL